jgi:hypothetical protein
MPSVVVTIAGQDMHEFMVTLLSSGIAMQVWLLQ